MNRKLSLSLIVLAAAAGSAFADDITIDPNPFVSTASRAQVMQELQQYRQSGVDLTALDYNPLMHFRSARTRAEVTAEYVAARDMVAAFNGEDSGSVYIARRDMARPGGLQYAAMPKAE